LKLHLPSGQPSGGLNEHLKRRKRNTGKGGRGVSRGLTRLAGYSFQSRLSPAWAKGRGKEREKKNLLGKKKKRRGKKPASAHKPSQVPSVPPTKISPTNSQRRKKRKERKGERGERRLVAPCCLSYASEALRALARKREIGGREKKGLVLRFAQAGFQARCTNSRGRKETIKEKKRKIESCG